MTKLKQISIRNDVFQNESYSGKFENLDVENKLSHTWCPFEPINSTRNVLFGGVVALFFGPSFLNTLYNHDKFFFQTICLIAESSCNMTKQGLT